MRTIRRILKLLTPAEKRRFGVVVLISLTIAGFDLLGVASVMPFLAVLANPELVQSNEFLTFLYNLLGFQSVDRFLLFLGLCAFGLLLVGAVVRVTGQYLIIRFNSMRRHSISARLLETYLGRPYEFFLNRHTGSLAKSVLSEVDQAITSALNPITQIITSMMTLTAMIGILLAVEPVVAIVSSLVIGTLYALVYFVVRRPIGRSGARRVAANGARFSAVSEAFGGMKDVKLLGRERNYLQGFVAPSFKVAREMAFGSALSGLPRHVIEAFAFGGILLISLLLMAKSGGATGGDIGEVLPVLGLFALAGYRMMPAIQGIYVAVAQIRFGAASVDTLYDDFFADIPGSRSIRRARPPAIGLRDVLELDRVSYRYPGDTGAGIHELSLSLPAQSTLGIVGGTGAGKTTLVDVILGLLVPQSGRIVVDGVEITDANVDAWQGSIGYVPQDIFLSDASVASNIAMGIPRDEIDMERVREVARMAQIADVIETLPNGYDSTVGERGVRLSGGQRQRIGIARALYHDPDVIVFDEATSALDNATEAEVMAAIAGLAGTKTLILIAHRLSTVKSCDRIAVLHAGRLVGVGTYDELARDNDAFKRIARGAAAA